MTRSEKERAKRERRAFSPEFKMEAVRLMRETRAAHQSRRPAMWRGYSPSLRAYGRLPVVSTAVASWCIALSACDRRSVASDKVVDALPNLVAEAGMRIGDVDDPDIGFSWVAGVDVDRDGHIYVLEASVPEIRVYSPDGALLRRIGRRGAGPGEFEGVPRFGVVGDTVWAVADGPDRITLFDRDGTVLSARRTESVVVPLPGGYGHVLPWMMRPDGKFTSHFARVSGRRNNPPTGVEPTDSIPVPFVLFDPTGAVTDTIGWAGRPPPRMWRPPAEDDFRLEFIEVGGGRHIVPWPPTTMPRWVALPDGYALVEAPLRQTQEDGVFTVTRFGLSGDTVYTRTLHYRPIRYSAADLDTIAARAARGERGGGVPYNPAGSPVPSDWEVIARRLRLAMNFPEFKQPLESAWLAQDESIWLRLLSGDDSTARWVLLDAQGQPRGQLELPSHLRIRWNRGDTFWAVEPDEYDVPWLVRFRIQPG